ncbi:MAG: hypothetical protein MRY57_01460 [Candidatus Pacebacteria bacterium]|nr:hypothetical protein [Candidatus Paceibacterota bacterium]
MKKKIAIIFLGIIAAVSVVLAIHELIIFHSQERKPTKFFCIGEFCDGSLIEEGISFERLYLPLVQNGEEFGCGAEIVMSPHVLSYSNNPITSTFKLLFDIKAESEFPDEELRNPLGFYTQLNFDRIELNDGIGYVYLTGSLYGPGHCSLPEVREQIIRAALQFDSIHRVEVFLNDSLYDWCEQDQSGGEGPCPEIPDYWIAEK